MAHYAVYRTDTRELQSVGSVVADPLPEGLALLVLDAAPDLGAVEWDTSTDPPAFVPMAPDPLGLALTTDEYRNRFTFAERAAIKAASWTDPEVATLEDDVRSAPVVRLGHPRTIAGVQLLRSKGLLTEARAAEILNPEWIPVDGAL